MIKRTACFGALRFDRWTMFGFGRLFVLLLLGTIFVGSGVESSRRTASLEDQQLLQHSFPSAMPTPLPMPHDTNMTENNVRRKRSSSSADTQDLFLPHDILNASHLPSLRDLLSDKKITVRLGLRVSFTGPCELFDPQILTSLNKEPGIYNIGEKKGLFTMRIVGIKKVDSTA